MLRKSTTQDNRFAFHFEIYTIQENLVNLVQLLKRLNFKLRILFGSPLALLLFTEQIN